MAKKNSAAPMLAIIVLLYSFTTIIHLVHYRLVPSLQQILNLAAQHLGNRVQMIILGIVDITLSLLK